VYEKTASPANTGAGGLSKFLGGRAEARHVGADEAEAGQVGLTNEGDIDLGKPIWRLYLCGRAFDVRWSGPPGEITSAPISPHFKIEFYRMENYS